MMKHVCFAVATLVLCGFVTFADEPPKVTHVGMVSPKIVCVEVRSQRREPGRQMPYQAQPGDKVTQNGKHVTVAREGKTLGALVGADGKILYTKDRVVGEKLDPAWADRPASYRVKDARGNGLTPVAVHRKSKPRDFPSPGIWQGKCPMDHVLFLVLPRALSAGERRTLHFVGSSMKEIIFTVDATRLRSHAVHVSQIGFRPDDPAKVAFLSCWMGTGGPLDYTPGLVFRVVDVGSGKAVFEGKAVLAKSKDVPEDPYKRNYNLTDVHLMDFSTLTRPGRYVVSVEGVGCSYPFDVADDVWRKAFVVSARGLYHHRSGIALGPPYTTYKRPRCFHPEDGVKVYASKTPLMDTGNGLKRGGGNFKDLIAGKTDQIVPNAWGAYMDAGDWDRRIQHLLCSRLFLELAAVSPEYFAKVSHNIPESGNDLPDVVDEALFNLDGYRRMQTADGGIRGGIESSEHPKRGEASWQESLTVMAYAPGIWSSHVYAGVAARAAHWLEAREPALAKVYRDSAVRAMRWAEGRLSRAMRDFPHQVKDARNLAAAELYRLTGDDAWHQVFLDTTAYRDPKAPLRKWQSHEQSDAAWVYLRTKRKRDEKVVANCRSALLKEADRRVAFAETTGFRWTKDPWRPMGWGAFTTPEAGVMLARAHVLTGEAKYLRALVLICQTGAGANPVNLCYTTGVGRDFPKHPLHVDSHVSSQPAPEGITVYGPQDVVRARDHWAQKLVARYAVPSVERWPAIEAYWDVYLYPMVCEYTVMQNIGPNAYVWGYLAARK